MHSKQTNADWFDPPYDARVVANFILHKYLERFEEMTQLRLYKLIYFSHGWYLAEYRRPLVWNHFEAWENGPVIKVVRDCFSRFQTAPIDSFSSIFDYRTGGTIELPHRLRDNDEAFVELVTAGYDRYTAGQLSGLTHARGSAWDLIWRAKGPVGRFGLRLTNDEILRDFQDIAVPEEGSYKGSPLNE